MPELPEVEIVKKSLIKKIKSRKIKQVIVRNNKLRFKLKKNFKNKLEGNKIRNISRIAKYIVLELSNKSYCVFHLGMSGTIHLIYKKKLNNITNTSFYNSPFLPKKHNHVEIVFDKFSIIYNDPRRFGFFQIIKNLDNLKKRFAHLGPEPFHFEFNLDYFKNFVKGKKKSVKDLLIDQKFVSGIGNIYANEILFMSKINPNRKIKFLNDKDCNQIIMNSKKVLLDAVQKGGSSIRDFKNIGGYKGSFQDNFKVYQREGLNCKRVDCKGIIIKKVITNRSTFFCNSCQN